MEKLLDGKTYIVTGAGRGIGRAVALLAASHGANVVVNDLGGSGAGEGSDAGPANDVVQEIAAQGGTAIANTASVTDYAAAQSMVEQAIAEFGGLDGVVNNAGILRDGIFHKMSEADFAAVVDVHLRGSFNVSRAAAPHFRSRESGAFVHMTSTSGLIGNFGQVNYGAAKAGIVGLSRCIALDMARFEVRSNAIAPFAWSRLVGTIPQSTEAEKARVERLKQMTPEKVAPLTVYLLGPQSSEVTGQVFAVRDNEIFLMSQPRPLRSVHRGEGWSVESIAAHAMPALGASFYPLERSGDVFSWDPV